MRVLVLTPDIYTRGGIARYTWTLASALGDLTGPENVRVLALLDLGGSAGALEKFRVLDVVTSSPTPAGKLRFAAKALLHGRRKYDLTICSHVAMAPIAAAMRVLYGTPFVVACHGSESWGRLPLPERVAIRGAHMVLPVSRYTAERMVEVNRVPRHKVRVLYNAVPDSLADSLVSAPAACSGAVSNEQARTVLSVGALSKAFAYKGFDTVIRALPMVLDAVPNLRYVVAGEGDNKENLRKLAADLGVGPYVNFMGKVSDAELAELYTSCGIFVLPSRTRHVDGGWEGEGFGRVYVEAALAGKPVVGSREGGAAEAVLDGKTGLLVDPASVTEVASSDRTSDAKTKKPGAS